MPTKAATPCRTQGCNGLVRNGQCNVCGSQRRDKDRAHDAQRGSAHERGYGANWRKVRRSKLASEPLCQDCKANGRVTIATEPHHIKRRRAGGENHFENLMTLCKTHRSQRTVRGE